MKTVAVFTYPDEAQIAVSVLEANGIECFLPDEYITSLDWFYTNAIGGIRVQVPDDLIDSAREVLRDTIDPELAPRCPYCESANLRQLRIRWGDVIAIVCGFLLPGHNARYLCQDCRKSFSAREARHDMDSTVQLEKEALEFALRDQPAKRLPNYFLFAVGCLSGAALTTALLPFRIFSDGTELSIADAYAIVTVLGGLCFYLMGLADHLRQKHIKRSADNKSEP